MDPHDENTFFNFINTLSTIQLDSKGAPTNGLQSNNGAADDCNSVAFDLTSLGIELDNSSAMLNHQNNKNQQINHHHQLNNRVGFQISKNGFHPQATSKEITAAANANKAHSACSEQSSSSSNAIASDLGLAGTTSE